MKKGCFILACLLTSLNIYGQITLTSADMPSSGDTFRVSIGLITPAIDPVPTGANHTWDFTNLQWVNQDVDTFLTVGATGAIYSVVFSNIPFNPNRSNQAVIGPDLPSLPQLTITDVYYFYYNASAGYDQKGFGAKLNGFQTPLPFDTPDRILDFPVNFGNMDSSDSGYDISVPGLGGYFHEQHRVNEVDGWGTLFTPFGSFNTLRVKSVINAQDSLDLDTLGGFSIPVPLTKEYKWYGQNSGIPLLQINTSTTFGFEVISSIRYRDSLRVLPTGIALPEYMTPQVTMFPNPANEECNVTIQGFSDDLLLELFDLSGRVVKSLQSAQQSKPDRTLRLQTSELSRGCYLIRISGTNFVQMNRLVIQ